MSLTSKQWHNLGMEIGQISKCMTRLICILHNKYGKSNTHTKLSFTFYNKYLCGLQSDLDGLIHRAYHKITTDLPDYNDISIRSVFYHLNRYTCEEANNFVKRIRPLPKSLTLDEMTDSKQSIEYITNFINKVDTMLFNNKNKHIKVMRKELIKLENFLE